MSEQYPSNGYAVVLENKIKKGQTLHFYCKPAII